MKSEDVGSIPIVEGDRLTAIVTDRDLALHVVAGGKSADTTVGEFASRELVTIDPDAEPGGSRPSDGRAPAPAAARRRGGRHARRDHRPGRPGPGRSRRAHGRGRPEDLGVEGLGRRFLPGGTTAQNEGRRPQERRRELVFLEHKLSFGTVPLHILRSRRGRLSVCASPSQRGIAGSPTSSASSTRTSNRPRRRGGWSRRPQNGSASGVRATATCADSCASSGRCGCCAASGGTILTAAGVRLAAGGVPSVPRLIDKLGELRDREELVFQEHKPP